MCALVDLNIVAWLSAANVAMTDFWQKRTRLTEQQKLCEVEKIEIIDRKTKQTNLISQCLRIIDTAVGNSLRLESWLNGSSQRIGV
jgi:hypothetical protein